MPVGLQVFKEDGSIVVDTTSRLVSVVHSFVIPADTRWNIQGSVTHTGFKTGTPVIFLSNNYWGGYLSGIHVKYRNIKDISPFYPTYTVNKNTGKLDYEIVYYLVNNFNLLVLTTTQDINVSIGVY